MNQVYPFLLNSQYGTSDVTPDIAESAEFTSPTEYTVKLKSGLKFANGHDLTSSDVKFSFERQLTIADPNGPSSLLGNLDSVETPDDTTVVFTLKNGDDQSGRRSCRAPPHPSSTRRSSRPTRSPPTTPSSRARPSRGSTRSSRTS